MDKKCQHHKRIPVLVYYTVNRSAEDIKVIPPTQKKKKRRKGGGDSS
jgi:hypothetical protein